MTFSNLFSRNLFPIFSSKLFEVACIKVWNCIRVYVFVKNSISSVLTYLSNLDCSNRKFFIFYKFLFEVFCFFDHFIDVFWTFFSIVNICYFKFFISYIVSTLVCYCTVFSCCFFFVKCVAFSINLSCCVRFWFYTWSYISIYSFIYYICSIFSNSSVDVVFLEVSYFIFWNFYSFFINISDFLLNTWFVVARSFCSFSRVYWSTYWIFYSYKFKTIFFYLTSCVRFFFLTFL